jgi:hypothetical protein
MRLRCPHKNCPIDVPDDLVGVRIRCPHCGEWLDVDPKHSDTLTEQIPAGVPDITLDAITQKPKPTQSIKLENQIYDGLPPLAVMMALHRQKGAEYDKDDYASRYPMTEDDWRALSAFESVLLSVVSLRTTLVVGAVALVVNLLVWLTTAEENLEVQAGGPISRIGTPVVMGLCFLAIYLGSQTLRRIKLDWLANLLPWSALAVMLVVVGNTLLNVLAIYQQHQAQSLGFLVVASIPFNVIAAFDSGRSAWLVGRSLDEVNPPEIASRLTEALRYLE